MKKVLLFLIVALISTGISYATLVGEEKEQCPVCEREIEVLHLVSFGSYIYERESKYDLIYFPFDDPRFIWTCPNCGYAQTYNLFPNLSEKEKKQLREFLADKWKPQTEDDISPETRFNQAILVNKFLEKDDHFWAWFNRILIYHYRKIDQEKAKQYAQTEIELLKRGKGDLEDDKKTRPYLLGEYNRMLGNNDLAKKYFKQAFAFDLVAETQVSLLAILLTDMFLAVLLVLLWCKKISTIPKRVIISTVILVGILSLSAIMIYIVPKLISYKNTKNGYYNQVIMERMKILYTDQK
jgi:uncharacterized protein (DUF2225 family)